MKKKAKSPATPVGSMSSTVIYADKQGRRVIETHPFEWRTVREPKRLRRRKAS